MKTAVEFETLRERNSTLTDPREEYANRLAARRAALDYEQQRSQNIWFWRRVVFMVIALMIILAFERAVVWPMIAAPVIVFIALMVFHQSIHAAVARLERAVRFYERGVARLEDDWSGGGEAGERFADKSHPYSEDLDLFGEGSLFELLSTARTKAGEERLASWLLTAAPIPEILARQRSVEELRPRLDLREDVALLGDEVNAGAHPEELTAWAARPSVFTARQTRWLRLAALLIGLFSAAAVVMWLGYGYRKTAMLALMVEATFLFLYRAQIGRVIAEVERPGRELSLLAEILGRLEQERFASPLLARLRSELDTDGKPPSRQIARLSSLIQILDSLKNQLFAPIAFVLLIPAQLALAIEGWRRHAGAKIPRWLDAVAEIEALSSLAGYAYASVDRGVAFGTERRAFRRRAARADRQRLEYVGQKHADENRRDECRFGAGRRAGEGETLAPVAARRRRLDSHSGLAADGRVALLRRDHAAAPGRRTDRRRAAAALSAR